MGGQGSPPGRNPTNVTLNVLVGDRKAGEADVRRALRLVPLGDRQPQGDRVEVRRSARACRTAGSADRPARWRRPRRAAVAAACPRPSRWPTARSWRARSCAQDDFLVVLTLTDGTRRTLARTDGVPQGRGQGSEGRTRQRDRQARSRGHDQQDDARHHRVSLDDQVERLRRAMKKLICSSHRLLAGPALLVAQQPPNPELRPERSHAARSRAPGLEGTDRSERPGAAGRRRPRSGRAS